jgi:hypothetical protein
MEFYQAIEEKCDQMRRMSDKGRIRYLKKEEVESKMGEKEEIHGVDGER